MSPNLNKTHGETPKIWQINLQTSQKCQQQPTTNQHDNSQTPAVPRGRFSVLLWPVVPGYCGDIREVGRVLLMETT